MQHPTERRLAQLEQQLQHNRRLNRLLLAAVLLLGFMGFRQQKELDHLSVKSLSVVNDKGKVVARLGTSANGSLLQLFDSTGSLLQTETGAGKSGGYLNLYNNKKKHTVWLTQMTNGGGYLGIKNHMGKDVAGMGVNKDQAGYAAISNVEGKERVVIGCDNGAGVTRWYNPINNTTVLVNGSDNNYSGGISINNRFGNQRNYQGVSRADMGATWLLNNNGKTTHQLDATGMLLKNYNEQERMWMGIAGNDGGFLNLYNRYNRRNIFIGARDGTGAEGILYTSDGFKDTGIFPR